MIILGIESSCDETSVGIVDWHSPSDFDVLANEIASSVDLQARFGGVVPEIASRAHLEAIVPTMERALRQAGIEKPDAIAVTIGPGLAGALIVGVTAAKTWAKAWNIPWYGVNHLAGHIAVDTVENGPIPPGIALLISGGHTQILEISSLGEPIKELGSTLDDAAGEAFDKVARLLDLPYPGGPQIQKIATGGNPKAINFPRGLTGSKYSKYDFSFSGLKSAVARFLEQQITAKQTINVPDVAASFQEAVADVLSQKTVAAAQELGYKTIILGGGASANSRIRELTTSRANLVDITVRYPRPILCTDNGLMIAVLAGYLIDRGIPPTNNHASPIPNLEISQSFV